MKAMVLEKVAPAERAPLVPRDVAVPEPSEREVRLKVRCCAVCRTDLHIVEGELPSQKLPVIPGHEIVGVVDKLGCGCKRLSLGQRIGVAWLRHTCGQCRFCRDGRENLCESQRFTGYHADGGYAQYAFIDEDFAYVIPDRFEDIQAAPLLCAGIVGYRSLKRANVPPGGRLAMYGFGSSAMLVAQVAMHRGAELYVVTRGEKHRRIAREMGVRWVGERAEDLPVKVDSAIIFAPAGELVPQALEKLEKGGTLSLADIYMTPIPQMDYEKHVFYERNIRSVTANTRQDGQEFLEAAAAIPIRTRTVAYPLEQANQALADLKADRLAGTAVLAVES